MSRFALLTALSSLALLTACGGREPEAAETETGQDDAMVADTDMATDTGLAPQDPADASATEGTLEWAVAGEWRGEDAARDAWRHPQETLEFFEIDPSGTIVEIWPGGGWYARILAPWIAANGGTYIGATFPETSPSEARREARANFLAEMASNPVYGEVQAGDFSADVGDIAPAGSVDAVLTFRNVHNWMGAGFAERAFADFYTVLRPGGVLGVVEHRLPDTREQDPRASTGYVQEAYVIALAEEAGFELVGRSDVNANPADTADHPFGVWTLPPVGRTSPFGEPEDPAFDRAPYDAIGESDRMTLLFRKPLRDNTPSDAEEDTGDAAGEED
ncbi:MAG: methyltransferase [Alphaproteobacteria bacterium]|nr:methyltransferase [Alphaproteobacteria bacterium]